MTDILAELISGVIKSAPAWLASLGSTLLAKGRDVAFDKGEDLLLARGKSLGRRFFHLDKKEQQSHLEQALRNATERGCAVYHTPHERTLYCEVIRTLSQQGEIGEALRREAMRLVALSEEPDLAALSAIYSTHCSRARAASRPLDAAPYLNSFFSALLEELWADFYFRPQLSDALQLRAARHIQRSLREVVSALQRFGGALNERYTAEDLARDIDRYTSHLERTLRYLKIVGIAPKDKKVDPELESIFVPLRVALTGSDPALLGDAPLEVQHGTPAIVVGEHVASDLHQTSLVAVLERSQILVLLGGPGSGKSTATKHLAWSHVVASQSLSASAHGDLSLLEGRPLPLRIELRVLSEERKRAHYDFLAFASDVLLKREGVEINPQMFKELLVRRGMVLIFDGLDEVNTLEERLGLVNEIEHFALCYPGNRILVTSRPVGYDLARFSHPLFFMQRSSLLMIRKFSSFWRTGTRLFSAFLHSRSTSERRWTSC